MTDRSTARGPEPARLLPLIPLLLVLGASLIAGCGSDSSDETSTAAADEEKPVRGFELAAVIEDKCKQVGGEFERKVAICWVETAEQCEPFKRLGGSFICKIPPGIEDYKRQVAAAKTSCEQAGGTFFQGKNGFGCQYGTEQDGTAE